MKNVVKSYWNQGVQRFRVQHRLLTQTKHLPCIIWFPSLKSSYLFTWTIKGKLLCQTYWDDPGSQTCWSVTPEGTVTCTWRNKKKWSTCRQYKMIFSTFAWRSCNSSLVELFHHPITHLYAKIGALDHSNNRKSVLKIWMQQGLQATMLDKDFSSLLT